MTYLTKASVSRTHGPFPSVYLVLDKFSITLHFRRLVRVVESAWKTILPRRSPFQIISLETSMMATPNVVSSSALLPSNAKGTRYYGQLIPVLVRFSRKYLFKTNLCNDTVRRVVRFPLCTFRKGEI